jgi:TusA-related sulfurtransferase
VLNDREERVVAKGLKPPGPLLIVKKKLPEIQAEHLRIIVSNRESVDELVSYFEERHAETEIDRAGDDYHVVVDLTGFSDHE